jgi:hypothetical protein
MATTGGIRAVRCILERVRYRLVHIAGTVSHEHQNRDQTDRHQRDNQSVLHHALPGVVAPEHLQQFLHLLLPGPRSRFGHEGAPDLVERTPWDVTASLRTRRSAPKRLAKALLARARCCARPSQLLYRCVTASGNSAVACGEEHVAGRPVHESLRSARAMLCNDDKVVVMGP